MQRNINYFPSWLSRCFSTMSIFYLTDAIASGCACSSNGIAQPWYGGGGLVLLRTQGPLQLMMIYNLSNGGKARMTLFSGGRP